MNKIICKSLMYTVFYLNPFYANAQDLERISNTKNYITNVEKLAVTYLKEPIIYEINLSKTRVGLDNEKTNDWLDRKLRFVIVEQGNSKMTGFTGQIKTDKNKSIKNLEKAFKFIAIAQVSRFYFPIDNNELEKKYVNEVISKLNQTYKKTLNKPDSNKNGCAANIELNFKEFENGTVHLFFNNCPTDTINFSNNF